MLSPIQFAATPLFSGRRRAGGSHRMQRRQEEEKLDAFERGLKALQQQDARRPHPVIRRLRLKRTVKAARRFLKTTRKADTPFIIGISGGSGSGKSTLVAALQAGNAAMETIAQDRYYRDMTELRAQYRQEAERTGVDRFRNEVDLNSPEAVSLGKAARHLRKLKNGRPVRIPDYDFITCTRHNKATLVQPTPIVVTEGVFGFANSALRRLMDLRVFMDIPPATQAERFWKRAPERGIRDDEAGRAFFADVQAKHDRFIQPTADTAHIVLDGAANRDDLQATVSTLAELVQALVKKPGG